MLRKILFKAITIGIKTVTKGKREMGLSSNENRWGFIAKEQVGRWAFLGGNLKATGFLLTSRILAEGNEGDRTSSVGGFSLNWSGRVLATVTGLCRPSKDRAKVEAWSRRVVRETWLKCDHRNSLSFTAILSQRIPPATVTPQEFIFLHDRLRGGEKGDNLDLNSGTILSPGTVPPFVGGLPWLPPRMSLPLTEGDKMPKTCLSSLLCSWNQPCDPVLATKREGQFSQVAFGKRFPVWMWSGRVPCLLWRRSSPTMKWQAWGLEACDDGRWGAWALGDIAELFHQPLNCLHPDFLMRWDNYVAFWCQLLFCPCSRCSTTCSPKHF